MFKDSNTDVIIQPLGPIARADMRSDFGMLATSAIYAYVVHARDVGT